MSMNFPSCAGVSAAGSLCRSNAWETGFFANLDPDASPMSEFPGPVVDEIAHLEPERFKLVEKHSIPVQCNWKVLMDAFQKVCHIKHIHPETVDAEGHPRPSLPEHEITDNSSRSCSLFPNIVTPVSTWAFPFLVFWPTNINSSRMDVWWFGQPDN